MNGTKDCAVLSSKNIKNTPSFYLSWLYVANLTILIHLYNFFYYSHNAIPIILLLCPEWLSTCLSDHSISEQPLHAIDWRKSLHIREVTFLSIIILIQFFHLLRYSLVVRLFNLAFVITQKHCSGHPLTLAVHSSSLRCLCQVQTSGPWCSQQTFSSYLLWIDLWGRALLPLVCQTVKWPFHSIQNRTGIPHLSLCFWRTMHRSFLSDRSFVLWTHCCLGSSDISVLYLYFTFIPLWSFVCVHNPSRGHSAKYMFYRALPMSLKGTVCIFESICW